MQIQCALLYTKICLQDAYTWYRIRRASARVPELQELSHRTLFLSAGTGTAMALRAALVVCIIAACSAFQFRFSHRFLMLTSARRVPSVVLPTLGKG